MSSGADNGISIMQILTAGTCATCGYNRGNDGAWDRQSEQPAFCNVRHVDIPHPLSTSCKNRLSRSLARQGPIFCLPSDPGGSPMPWYDRVEPTCGFPAICAVCGKSCMDGISLTISEGTFGFCGGEHYVAWRETRLIARMRHLIQLAENAYSEMYETSSPTGLYSDVKESFYMAMQVAIELDLSHERREIEARLEHIKAVYRSQFR